MTLPEIVQAALAVGAGSGGVGIGAWSLRGLVLAVSHAMKTRSDAKLAESKATQLMAETEQQAQAHDDRVYDDLRADLVLARRAIADLGERLTKSEAATEQCRDNHREAMERADEAMRVACAQQLEIEALHRLMKQRGITPPDMLAVKPRVGGESL